MEKKISPTPLAKSITFLRLHFSRWRKDRSITHKNVVVRSIISITIPVLYMHRSERTLMREIRIRIRSKPEHIRRTTHVIDGDISAGEITRTGGGGVRGEVGVALVVYSIERSVT
jgi:hypothetical protein